MSEFDAASARFASPMERLLYLRSTATMAQLRGPALSTMAQRARELFVRAGTRLLSAEARQTDIYFLVQGEVTIRLGELVVQRITPPGTVGFLPMLGQAARAQVVVAETKCQLLAVPVADVMELLEEDYFFVGMAIRGFMARIAESQASLETAGRITRSEPQMGQHPGGAMDFVQRLRRLRVGPYAQCPLDAVADLAEHAKEVRYGPGEVIWREGEPGDYGLNVVYGIVDCQGDAPPRRFSMGADSTVGVLQAHALVPRGYSCTARTEVIALRGDVESINDIIEDHPPFGLMVLGFVANLAFDMDVKLAEQALT